jgi:hypothetical protein
MTRILIRTLHAFSDYARVVIAASVLLLLLVMLAAPSIQNVTGEAANASRTNFFSPPPVIGAPTNLSVSVTASNVISLGWNAPAGIVEHYEIERSENALQPFVFVGNTAGGETFFNDLNVTNLHAYLYRVRAVETGVNCAFVSSEPSNMALGTAVSFDFNQLTTQTIRAKHFQDVRDAINAVRATANLTPATWLRGSLNNLEIKAQDVQEMRDRLGEALAVLSIPVEAYDDSTLATGANGTVVRATHLEQLQIRATRGRSTGSGRAASPSDRAILGEFVAGATLPLTPVHMNVLPDGRVLFWGRDRFLINGVVKEQTGTSQAYVWDPLATPTPQEVDNPTTNLFCSGHSLLPDGRVLVSGGHRDADADGDGEPHLNIFDFRNNSWIRTSQDMNFGRWYPYNVTLPSGKTLIVSGTYFQTSHNFGTRKTNTVPQIYNSDNGCVDSLNDAGTDFFTMYPFLHVRPDGQVLQVQSPGPFGPMDRRSRLFNPLSPPTGAWPNFASTNDDHGLGSSVLFESGGKALVVGGFTTTGGQPNTLAEYLDLQTGSSWTRIAPMNFKRAYHTATILPDGKVLVTGGTSCPGGNNVDCADRAALNAEMWDATAFNAAQPTAVPWRIMAREAEIRAYHSLAVLLPDATVLVAGGGRPGAVGEYFPNCSRITDFNEANAKLFGHPRVEIYSPPYLFNSDGTAAPRPEITSAPPAIFYGKSFSLGTSGAGTNPKVSLVRLASVTHGFNQDQRQVSLFPTFISASTITVTGPADSNRCPPGYYMLFVLNNGVPSIAKIVRVGGTSIFPTDAPVTTAPGQGSTWEQGIEFSASVSGEITHIRFWKAVGETGQHVGRIWNTAGQELAEVTFNCETASGWQQAALSTPLPITAGVRYRVTYNINTLVAKTFNVLDSPITIGPLTGWGSWFSTPAGTFPTSGSGSNLFADVVFRATP